MWRGFKDLNGNADGRLQSPLRFKGLVNCSGCGRNRSVCDLTCDVKEFFLNGQRKIMQILVTVASILV